MWFSIIRYIFWIAVFLLIMAIIRKRPPKAKKIIRKIAIGFVIIGWVLSNRIAIENYFITFPSAESAYNYSTLSSPSHVIDGEFSSMVIVMTKRGHTVGIVPKGDGGWKIDTGDKVATVFAYYGSGFEVMSQGSGFVAEDGLDAIIMVYRYSTTNDYYITVYERVKYNELKQPIEGTIEVYDANGSEFQCLAADAGFNDIYAAYINDYKAPYVLYVNGEAYELEFEPQ